MVHFRRLSFVSCLCGPPRQRERAKQLGVALTEIADSLQVFMGAQYINDFDFNARSYRVYAQADRQLYRAKAQGRNRVCG